MKRGFSLIEIMVALLLIALFSGTVGVQTRKLIEKKRFRSQAECLCDRLTVTQKIAVAMQTDWKIEIRKEAKKWVLEAKCSDPEIRELKPLKVDMTKISLDKKELDLIEIDLYATGLVRPKGVLIFSLGEESIKWEIGSGNI